jgi:hypothetical protein
MVASKALRLSATPIGSANIEVIQAAYALSKARSEQAATEIMQSIPAAIYSALAKHMHERPNLFLPEVHAAATRLIEAPKVSKAEALFA